MLFLGVNLLIATRSIISDLYISHCYYIHRVKFKYHEGRATEPYNNQCHTTKMKNKHIFKK